MIPVNRFASDPNFEKYQTETGAFSSLFEHSFNNAVKVRQNLRFAHVEGIYRSAIRTSISIRTIRQIRIFRFSIRRRRTVERFI